MNPESPNTPAIPEEPVSPLKGRALFDKLDEVRFSLSNVHTALAKTNLPAEIYNPISHLLAQLTLDLIEIHKSCSYMDDCISVDQEIINEKEMELLEQKNEIERLKELLKSNYQNWHKTFYRTVSTLTESQISNHFIAQWENFAKNNNIQP